MVLDPDALRRENLSGPPARPSGWETKQRGRTSGNEFTEFIWEIQFPLHTVQT